MQKSALMAGGHWVMAKALPDDSLGVQAARNHVTRCVVPGRLPQECQHLLSMDSFLTRR